MFIALYAMIHKVPQVQCIIMYTMIVLFYFHKGWQFGFHSFKFHQKHMIFKTNFKEQKRDRKMGAMILHTRVISLKLAPLKVFLLLLRSQKYKSTSFKSMCTYLHSWNVRCLITLVWLVYPLPLSRRFKQICHATMPKGLFF